MRLDGATHRTLVAVDVERSSDGRDTRALATVRAVLAAGLHAASAAAGLDDSDWDVDDRGDGMLLSLPPSVPKSRLLVPFLPELALELREHNRTAAPQVAFRVRVALHEGDVLRDANGVWVGRQLVELVRLLESRQLRARLASADETESVAHIVSDGFHRQVVLLGHRGIEPSHYHRVDIDERGVTGVAWVHDPHNRPRPADRKPRRPDRPATDEPHAGINFGNATVTVNGDVVNGSKYVGRD